MNIIWLSANKLGYELLKEILTIPKINIKAIITLSNQAKTIMYDGIDKQRWSDFNLPVFKINNINEREKLIKDLSPDLILVCGWRQIINKNILDIPKKGVIGFHPTLLPKGRGPAPIINSIIHEFNESGLTMYYMGEGLDDGDIISQEKFIIEDTDHAEDVYNKIIDSGRKLIKEQVPLLIKGIAQRIPQDESKATVFSKRSLKDNELDIENETLKKTYNKIRAFSKPYNGAYIRKDGKKMIIWRAELKE